MTGATIQPNWYPDPTGRHQVRYWDGQAWTENVADHGVASTDQPTMSMGAPDITGAASSSAERVKPVFAWLAAAGGALMFIGAFLKAESASVYTFSASQSFISRNAGGVLVLILGLGIAGVGIMLATGNLPRWGGWMAAGLGAFGALIALLNWINIANDVKDANNTVGHQIAKVGAATPVALLGGLVATTFGVLAVVLRQSPTPATPPTATPPTA